MVFKKNALRFFKKLPVMLSGGQRPTMLAIVDIMKFMAYTSYGNSSTFCIRKSDG